MRRFGNKTLGVVAAMENDNLVSEPTDLAAEIGDNAENLETELLEVADTAEEVVEEETRAEEGTETVEALENLAMSLESAIQNGGLDRNGAMVLNQSLSYHYDRAGIGRAPKISLESFGSHSSRLNGTKHALEEINANIKKIWEAIKAALARAAEFFVKLYKKFFDAATKLKDRADKLAATAGKVSGTAKSATLENERVAAALAVGGKVDAPASAAQMRTLAGEFLKAYNEVPAKAGNDLLKSFEAVGRGEFSADSKTVEQAVAAVKELVKPVGATEKGSGEAPEGIEVVQSHELPGGKNVIWHVPTAATPAAVLAARAGMDGAKDAKGPKTLDVLSVADAVKVAEQVADMAKDIAAAQDAASKNKALKDKFARTADSIGAQVAKQEAGEGKDNLKFFQQLAAKVPNMLEQPYAAFNMHALSSGKALLDLVEESLKQYAA